VTTGSVSELSIAVAQPPCTPGDVAANAAAHADAVRRANGRVVVFPELSLTGYELDADPVVESGEALGPLREACAETGSIALAGAPVSGRAGAKFIATLRVTAEAVDVVYRKVWLGGDEAAWFEPGDRPAVIEVDGWRLGLGICKDTRVSEHVAATAERGIDVYLAGLVHLPEELADQDARGVRIARQTAAHVAFASCAAPTGGGFDRTAGHSTIWSPDGSTLARAGKDTGEVVSATITRASAGLTDGRHRARV
jgi:predicted amidohydrolase